MTGASDQIVESGLRSFGVLLELERRIRRASSEQELAFLMVNETFSLSGYRQAMLWRRGGIDRVLAVSGLAIPDPNAPFMVWSCQLFRHLDSIGTANEIMILSASDVPEKISSDWNLYLPGYALWMPMASMSASSGEKDDLGGLLLCREEPWSEAEKILLGYLSDAYSHAWAALKKGRGRFFQSMSHAGKKKIGIAIAAIILVIALLPVHQSVLAPAEVIAKKPVVVRSPMDGVVNRFEVKPNEMVKESQPLLRLDDVRLKNRLEIARKALEVSEAEYRQTAQMAIYDQRSKNLLVTLKGQMDQHASEVNYVEELMERIVIRTPRPGIAIFEDENEWTGKPVVTGERILMVADPSSMELEIRLPVSDAIATENGASVRFFMNTNPHRPVDAKLRYASYQASQAPDGHFAYRLVATFDENPETLRIGLKGTAKIEGEKTILAFHILRRPLSTLRRTLGL